MPTSKPESEWSESYKHSMPNELNGKHRALMRLLCAGASIKEAAELLNFPYNRAVVVANSPLFKEEKARMLEAIAKEFVKQEAIEETGVRERLNKEAITSLKTLIQLRDNASSEGVKERVSMDLLDRAGFKSPDKVELDAKVEVGESVAEALKHALKVLGSSNDKVKQEGNSTD